MNKVRSRTPLPSVTPPRPVFATRGGSLKPAVAAGDVGQIGQRYVFDDRRGVEEFLNAQPRVVPVLLEALLQVERFFGAGTVVTLRVLCDQEEGGPSLAARIRTAGEASEARAARKAFNASWWMRQTDAETLPLTFGVEFV